MEKSCEGKKGGVKNQKKLINKLDQNNSAKQPLLYLQTVQ